MVNLETWRTYGEKVYAVTSWHYRIVTSNSGRTHDQIDNELVRFEDIQGEQFWDPIAICQVRES
jgi:hypothetical protein